MIALELFFGYISLSKTEMIMSVGFACKDFSIFHKLKYLAMRQGEIFFIHQKYLLNSYVKEKYYVFNVLSIPPPPALRLQIKISWYRNTVPNHVGTKPPYGVSIAWYRTVLV